MSYFLKKRRVLISINRTLINAFQNNNNFLKKKLLCGVENSFNGFRRVTHNYLSFLERQKIISIFKCVDNGDIVKVNTEDIAFYRNAMNIFLERK